MAAADLQISENSFLVKYFDMVHAKLHLVWGHFQHGNPAMPFSECLPCMKCRSGIEIQSNIMILILILILNRILSFTKTLQSDTKFDGYL